MEKKVKGQDPVEVKYTAKAKFHKENETEVIHRHLAENLEARGIVKITKGK